MPQSMRKGAQREEETKLAALQSCAAARLARIAAPDRKPAAIARTLAELDARACERVTVDYPAIVICEENEDTPAMIVDLSSDGVRLRFSRRQHLQESLLLDSPAFKGFVVARVKWQNGSEAGLAFDHLWTKRLSAPFD